MANATSLNTAQSPTTVIAMRRIVLLISAVSLAAASCTSAPESTVEARSTVTTIANVGEIANSENNETAPEPQPASAAPSTAVASPASTSAPLATVAPTAPPTVAPTAPPTVAPNPTQPATTSVEPVGDGPVLTSPPQTAGDNGALVPVFFGFSATATTGCANADPGTVELKWEVIGTESVSIAIGTDTQVFRTGEPPAGSLDVPLDCAASSTYFVIATNPGGRTVRSATVAP